MLKFWGRGSGRAQFFASPSALLIEALLVTLLLSYGAASLAGQSFIGSDLFSLLLEKVMELDGIKDGRAEDFLEHLGLYGTLVCLILGLLLVVFIYFTLALLSLIAMRLYAFLKRFIHRKQETLPTEDSSIERLFDKD